MFYQALVALQALCIPVVHSQGVSTYSDPSVPTGTPVPGNYTGSLRPQAHFSPPKGHMNDPNGLFLDANNTWHMYYQYNPVNISPTYQHWGHATSQDLYHWTNQQIALFPPADLAYVYSGSAVVDVNNTSGFFPDQDNGVVAMFTFQEKSGLETQNIAYSLDGGFTFQYYDNNPVINVDSNNFRDPHVIWYENHWVVVVSYAADTTIGVYTSSNLRDWDWTSNFTSVGLTAGAWECPNIVKMPVRDGVGGAIVDSAYVMSVSVQGGGPQGDSTTQYFIGSFNGTHFTPQDSDIRLVDFGPDNYAGQFYYGIPDGDNAVYIAWSANLADSEDHPTGELEGWVSTMTSPRANYLVNDSSIGFVIVDEIDPSPILGGVLNQSTFTNGNFVVDYSSVASGALLIDINVTNIDTASLLPSSSLNLSFSTAATDEVLSTGFFFGGDPTFFVNRTRVNSNDDPFFANPVNVTDTYYAAGSTDLASWSLRAIIDRIMLEVVLGGGIHVGTVQFFPTEPLDTLDIVTADLPSGAQVAVSVSALNSAWTPFENSTGIVVGNVTTTAPTKTRRLLV
ncbi:glycosyl hydrolase [Xylariaceae sp. FL0255]|nr:glycosyl hydrolase [Xylariaceae sp. FL0255]